MWKPFLMITRPRLHKPGKKSNNGDSESATLQKKGSPVFVWTPFLLSTRPWLHNKGKSQIMAMPNPKHYKTRLASFVWTPVCKKNRQFLWTRFFCWAPGRGYTSQRKKCIVGSWYGKYVLHTHAILLSVSLFVIDISLYCLIYIYIKYYFAYSISSKKITGTFYVFVLIWFTGICYFKTRGR